MQILQHFIRTNTANFIIYRLTVADWNQFINKLTDDFRLCYIQNKALTRLARKARISKSEFLERHVIPDVPNIMSGDFGELLCYFMVREHLHTKGLLIYAPKKWIWKYNRNKAAPGVDAIFFHTAVHGSFTSNDSVFTVESKMKAVNSNHHNIQEAIDGAEKDKLTRLAKTLNWLEEKYARSGMEDRRAFIERFKDPATYGTYHKMHKAIAIVDSTLEATETAKPVNNQQGISVIVLSINDLKKAYEDLRVNIIASV